MADRYLHDPESCQAADDREFGPETVRKVAHFVEDRLDKSPSDQTKSAIDIPQANPEQALHQKVESLREENPVRGFLPFNLGADHHVGVSELGAQGPEVARVVLAIGIGEKQYVPVRTPQASFHPGGVSQTPFTRDQPERKFTR